MRDHDERVAGTGGRSTRTIRSVPLYEYRCRTCEDRFELRRPMAEADAPASCPGGHADVVRLLAAFAATGRATATMPTPAPAGGPCGGACACYPDG
jgi:putative FmdB family regulatory protein